MMKKLLMVGLALVIIFLAIGTASAHVRFHFFGFFPLPPALIAPAPGYYSPGYYSPGHYSYYPPYPRYPRYDYRVWVPGHWEWRWTGYGWRKAWIPGYWRYGP